MLLRGLEQCSQQLAVARLELGPRCERLPRLGGTIGEVVANPLEVAEAEEAGRRSRTDDQAVDLDPGKGLCGEAPQLALEAGDLAAQLRPRRALVDADALPDTRPVSDEKLLHGLGASVDDGWLGEGRVG